MRQYALLFASAFALLPLGAFAATSDLPGGFAPSSVFASKSKAVAGETISLFTTLYNGSSGNLSGDAVFSVDGTRMGTQHFNLSAGDAQTISVPWQASEGAHTIGAHLENLVGTSGATTSVEHATSDTFSISVAPPPPPSPASQALSSVVTVAQNIASVPAISNGAQRAYTSLEFLRQNAVNTLEQQLVTSIPKKSGSVEDSGNSLEPSVLGTSTSNLASSATGVGVFGTIWHTILTALLFLCRIQVLFYISLLVLIFILYKIMRALLAERAHSH